MTPVIKARAETPDDLFKKVFGKNQEIKKIVIDATLGDFYLGEVAVSIMGEKILSLSGTDLEKILHDKIREEKIPLYTFGATEVSPAKLPFKINYFPSELRVALELSPNDLKPHDANVFDELIPYYSRKAAEPASFSFGTNYKLEDVQVRNLDLPQSFQAQTDSFMNIKSVAAENQMNYLSTRQNNQWYRQNSKLTYDRPNRMQRLEIGDVNFPIIGLQQSRSIGGISFYRDFSLNPYRATGPTSSFEYDVETRSLVRTYINNTILKTEYMNPGRYSVKDIPLNNGINKIIVELTDDFGKKKILIFNEAGSLDLLAPGLNRYSLAAGYPSTDTDTTKQYDEKNGAFLTGFYQHGFNKNWSAGGYGQGNKNFTLLGTNNILATRFGNWAFDAVGSKNKFHAGDAVQATYQLNLFGAYWYDSHTLTTKIEYRSPWFNEAGENFENRFDIITSLSYSVPLFERFNLALGGNYQNPRIGDTAKLGFDTSLTAKVFQSSSLTFYWARNRDDNKLWSTQLYFFLNMTFGDSSTFVSAFYEKQSQTKRLTVIHDNGKQLNNLKMSASVDDNSSSRNGALDLQYNTTLADLGAREEIINNKGHQAGTKTSLRFLSSFAFVHNGSDSGFSISRPISNSYVLFKPNEGWRGQRFGVQSTNSGDDSSSGLFGESLISGLTPYQYRRLQLDPSHLEPGYILGQESFVVYPHYRSGHLFVVGKSGLLVLRGFIVDKDKKPQPLKVGFWTSTTGKVTPFFTGREGEFFVEGVEPTKGKIQLDDEQFEAKEINLESSKKGLIDIGNIELPYKESRL
ncbi:MAG: fimbrial biogenesis outer membrane usher protein [Bacteriovorax sp.]|nr:fimbrial biogenesis outer membrane usher protein [Bacteriovorax sp.]